MSSLKMWELLEICGGRQAEGYNWAHYSRECKTEVKKQWAIPFTTKKKQNSFTLGH